jgi:hypothetical protein
VVSSVRDVTTDRNSVNGDGLGGHIASDLSGANPCGRELPIGDRVRSALLVNRRRKGGTSRVVPCSTPGSIQHLPAQHSHFEVQGSIPDTSLTGTELQ